MAAGFSVAAALLALLMPDLSAESRAEQGRGGHASVRSVLLAQRHTLLTLGVAVMVISASRSVRTGLLPAVGRPRRHPGQHHVADLRAGRGDRHRVLLPGRLADGPPRPRDRRRTRRRAVAVACFLLPLTSGGRRRDRGDGADRGRQRPRLRSRDDHRRRHGADGRPVAVPGRLAAVRRHRQHAAGRCSSARSQPWLRSRPRASWSARWPWSAPAGWATGPAGWTGSAPGSG